MWICSNAINTLGTIWAKEDFEFAYDYDVVSKLQILPAFLLLEQDSINQIAFGYVS